VHRKRCANPAGVPNALDKVPPFSARENTVSITAIYFFFLDGTSLDALLLLL